MHMFYVWMNSSATPDLRIVSPEKYKMHTTRATLFQLNDVFMALTRTKNDWMTTASSPVKLGRDNVVSLKGDEVKIWTEAEGKRKIEEQMSDISVTQKNSEWANKWLQIQMLLGRWRDPVTWG